jgi:hypothetical protein
MKKTQKKFKKLLISFIITILVFPQVTLAATEVYVTPATHTVEINSLFTVPIIVRDVADLKIVNFNITFDSSVITFLDGNVESLITAGCSDSSFISTEINPGTYNIVIDTNTCSGITGTGHLADLNFFAGATEGATAITFDSETIYDSNFTIITSTWSSANIIVEDNTPEAVPVDLTPVNNSVFVGDTYSLTLSLTNALNVSSVMTTLNYDDTLLFYNDSVAQGDFASNFITDNSIDGELLIYTETPSGVNGNLDIATINFIAIGAGTISVNQTGGVLGDTSYSAIPSVWNSATVTINELDFIKPEIFLSGDTVIDITIGNTYTELGAVATDNVDGDLTSAVVINSSTLNTNKIGSYLISYDVLDSSNNLADTVYRTINVMAIPDTEAPVITLVGDAVINLYAGDAYTEFGAIATDNVEGDLTSLVEINNFNVDTNIVGSYSATYNVADSSGNIAETVTRTINILAVPDTEAPIITLVGDAVINLYVGDTYTELGATATDNVDGNLTSAVVIDNSNVNTSIAGSYSATYNVTDSSSNVAEAVARTINVIEKPDLNVPVRTNGKPSGKLPAGTKEILLTLATDEDAICSYSSQAGTNFQDMTNEISTIPSTNHSVMVQGLKDKSNYKFYIRCQDKLENTNLDDYQISFSVAKPGKVVVPKYTDSVNDLSYVVNPNSILFSWNNPVSEYFYENTIFRAERRISKRYSYDRLKSVGEIIYQGNTESFEDYSIVPNKKYYYAIISQNRDGYYSNPIIKTLTSADATQNLKEIEISSYNFENEAKVIAEHDSWVVLDENTKDLYVKASRKYKKEMSNQEKYAIASFIHNGTASTKDLGPRKRVEALDTFSSSYNKLPTEAGEWESVIRKINEEKQNSNSKKSTVRFSKKISVWERIRAMLQSMFR